MKILITGGAGFVGSHLIEKLNNEGHEILVIDNFFAGKKEYIPSNVNYLDINLGTVKEEEFVSIVQEFNPDYVVHLAAIHFIPYCMSNPDETFASNIRSTNLVVRSLEGLKTKKIVAASSADVYGAVDQVHNEGHPTEPCNIYGLSKLLTEQIIEYGTRTNEELSGVSLRFFNIYGPQETNPHLIPRVIDLIKSSELDEFRMGYLGATRDFVHVTDIVEAIVCCLFNDTGKYDVYNVGTGVATPVRKVISLLKEFANDNREVIEDVARFRKFDRESLTANIEKLQKLGWSPKVNIEDGLRSLIKHEINL